MTPEQLSDSSLLDLARGGDPAAGLGAIGQLRHLLDEAEAAQVERARSQGWSWQDIGQALGITRQAAHHRHGSARRRLGRR